MFRILSFLLLAGFMASCNTARNPLFGKRSAHAQYAESLEKSGLDKSVLGTTWLQAAEDALRNPQNISLPYKETGFFGADKPSAAGFVFTAARGESVVATLISNPDSVRIFFELWRPGTKSPSLIEATDTSTNEIRFTINKEDSLLLRIQPELLVDLEYTLTVKTEPSLDFPVAEGGKPNMISFWGNPRDDGARKHEGVDIGARFRTPVLAAANGRITRVNENTLGGKVIFLRAEKTGDHLYYAHLDSQIVVTGQRVKIGDTLGLIGNTGNAKNTPPHLHFGIYTSGGAVNPFPFINRDVKEPAKITASTEKIHQYLRTTNPASIYEGASAKAEKIQSVPGKEPVFILAATADWYKVKLLDNIIGYMSSASLTDKNVQLLSVTKAQKLRVWPSDEAPARDSVLTGEKVPVLGVYQNYYLVDQKGLKGWIVKP